VYGVSRNSEDHFPYCFKRSIPLGGELPSLRSLENIASVRLNTPSGDINVDSGTPEILITLGQDGREENTAAIAVIACKEIDPETITEENDRITSFVSSES
jgi:hypothetical protein